MYVLEIVVSNSEMHWLALHWYEQQVVKKQYKELVDFILVSNDSSDKKII